MTKPHLSTIILSVLLVLAGISLASPAQANSQDVVPEAELVKAMERVPGGDVIDSHTAYWPDLQMTMTVPDERLRDAIGTCPHGSVCAFSGPTLSGTRLAWTTCGTHSTAALGAVGSIANAKTSGTLQARYGTTVMATASAQSWNNVTGTVNNVHC